VNQKQGLQALRDYLGKLRAAKAPPPAIAELEHIIYLIEGDWEHEQGAQRRLIDQLAQSARLAELGTMSASILHEMNQPLLGIKGFGELIQENLQKNNSQKLGEWTTEILKQVARIQDQQRRITNFLRHDESQIQSVRLADVLQETLKIFEHRINKRRIKLRISVPTDLPVLKLNHLQLNQILTNLIGNSLDALESRPTQALWISAAIVPNSQFVQLLVADNGAGIKPEIGQRLFEPFFSTKGDKGTGLGLYISRTLARACGGELALTDPSTLSWAEASPTTVFTLTIPVVDEARQTSATNRSPETSDESGDQKPQPPPSARVRALSERLTEYAHSIQVSQRVLLVDDEPVIQSVLGELLAGHNILCDTVFNAEEALAYLTDKEYAVALCDKNLPDMSGIELLKKIKQQWPRIEVLVITGYASSESAIEALGEGAFDYILKPFPDVTLIKDKVCAALARHDFEVRMLAMLDYLVRDCKSVLAERDQGESEASINRLREILASSNQDEHSGPVLLIGPAVMQNIVTKLGHRAIRVESLKLGVETLKQVVAQVVIYVEEAGEPDGAEAVRIIKAQNPTVGILVVSNSVDLKHIIAAIGAGVGDYMPRSQEGQALFEIRLRRLISRQQRVMRYQRLFKALKNLQVDLVGTTPA
jgi:signal transduction histidine kinase/DNA-binding response OmpR family regulator